MSSIHDLSYWASVSKGPDPRDEQVRQLFAAVVLHTSYLQCKMTGHTDEQVAGSCVSMADAMLVALKLNKEPHGTDA